MSNTQRRIVIVIAAVSLCVLLAAVAYAFGLYLVEVKENYFHTGAVAVSIELEEDPNSIDLTDDICYEPGMTVRGAFTVYDYKIKDGTRISSTDENGIYYRIYFAQLEGPLANVMEARIYDSDGKTVLYSGPARDLTRPGQFPEAQHMPYREGGNSHSYILELHYPKTAGNETQKKTMTFALAVKAAQSTANPGRAFE